MAAKPIDIFIRRTGALFFNIALVQRYKANAIALMQELLGWSDELAERYATELEDALRDAVVPQDLQGAR